MSGYRLTSREWAIQTVGRYPPWPVFANAESKVQYLGDPITVGAGRAGTLLPDRREPGGTGAAGLGAENPSDGCVGWRLLFEGPYFESGHDIVVTPDGKGFILIRESDTQTGPREMQVVVNWLEELKQRAHTRN
jgi:hypothetical protein